MRKNFAKKTGTSLIEFSLIILFVGIFFVAVYQGYYLYLESKLVSAKTLTTNSIVARLKNQVFWFETTLDESFVANENADDKAISKWNNIKIQVENSVNFYAPQNTNPNSFNYEPNSIINVSGPKYKKYGINGLPTLNFVNSGSISQFLVNDLNNKVVGNDDFYIYLVAEIDEFSKSAVIFDNLCLKADNVATSDLNLAVNNCNPKLTMKIDPLGNVNSIVTDNLGASQIETDIYYSLKPKAYIFSLQRTYGGKFSFEVDGQKVLYDKNDTLGDINFFPIKLGRHSSISDVKSEVNISEFIVINGSITTLQKKEIENYLAKKFNIKLK